MRMPLSKHIGVEVFVQLLSTTVRRRLRKAVSRNPVRFFFAMVTVMMAAYAQDKAALR